MSQTRETVDVHQQPCDHIHLPNFFTQGYWVNRMTCIPSLKFVLELGLFRNDIWKKCDQYKFLCLKLI